METNISIKKFNGEQNSLTVLHFYVCSRLNDQTISNDCDDIYKLQYVWMLIWLGSFNESTENLRRQAITTHDINYVN